ncbi:MAG TPA: SPOR domain-containing protein [Aliiroseovarius sp.]|nr:SPOR domain-containing protein [Aliiroseovarius sp.]
MEDVAPQAPTETRKSGGIMNVVGAVLSIALLIGLGVWGYRLAVRDVSGVPVVRALEGPMRIQPDDPGGESAAYQGYSVNNVQAEGGAAAPADRLALAPRNIGLAAEDAPANPDVQVSAQIPDTPASPPATPTAAPQTPANDMAALVDQLTEGADPLSGGLSDVTPTSSSGAVSTQVAADAVVAQVALESDVIPASVPGVKRSPRPASRPAGLLEQAAARAAAAAPEATAPVQAVQEVAASDIPVGTRLVQLGAFDSPEVARAEWDRLAVKFEDYLMGKPRVVQQATSGGKTFWRLRALGFNDLSDARRFCAVLMSGKAACIPVVTR